MAALSSHSRMPFVDLAKALAAQVIVLHHLAWYGPLSHEAAALGPLLANALDWLATYGRYAVAVFIVTGGFLAAQSLSPHGLPQGDGPLCLIRERYLRLVAPYTAALLIAVASAPVVHALMTHESTGSLPRFGQFVAHVLLVQGLLGIESLSAGVWYVAIDFQLYALLVLMLWLGQRFGRRGISAEFRGALPVVALALASLFYFNLDARWDSLPLFFFGTYALGVCSGWATRAGRTEHFLPVVAAVAAVAVVALWVEFRPRIAIGLLTALVLGWGQIYPFIREARLLRYFSRNSYALFLIHFPVCLLVSAIVQKLAPHDPWINGAGLALAWLASNVAAHYFHQFIELPLGRWQRRFAQCGTRKNPAGQDGAAVPAMVRA